MPNAELIIYIRKKNAHGQWESPRKVRELRGRRTGDLKPPFNIRPLINGKQTPKLLMAQTYAEAKEEAASFAAGLKAKAKGLQVPEIDALNRPTLRDTVRIYLEQKSGKAPKTIAAHRNTLEEFAEAARVQYLDQVTESVLRRYKNFMEQKGHAGKTQDTRPNIVYFMLISYERLRGSTFRVVHLLRAIPSFRMRA